MKACTFCNGKKVITNPAQQLQPCPICEGTGVDTASGFPFFYNKEVALTALQVSDQTITIQNGDFVALFFMAQSTGAFKVTLKDQGKNYPLSEEGIHQNNIAGTAQNPFPLLKPWLLQKGGLIGLQLTDLSNANNTVRFTIHGIMVP